MLSTLFEQQHDENLENTLHSDSTIMHNHFWLLKYLNCNTLDQMIAKCY